jgi:hypothetical protein
VGGILLAPVLDQNVLGSGHHIAGCLQPREPSGDDAAVARRVGRIGARVGQDADRAPQRSGVPDQGVVGVADVDVRSGREAGIELQSQQPAVPEVVDVRAEIGEEGRGGVGEVGEDEDTTALLGDEDAPVGREGNRGRIIKSAQDHRFVEARLKRRGARSPGAERG